MLGNVLNPPARPSRRPSRRRRRRVSLLSKYVKHGLVGIIAFWVAALLLGQIIPSPVIPSNVVFVGPKYDYYKVHKDDYNALFFGSSRVYSHIIPEIFDETAEANGPDSEGLAINSYNFGIPAMRAIDSTVLLEQVLSNPPENLKWVFFESILDKGYEPITNARSYRVIYWHNWENTLLAARYVLTSDESLPNKAVLLASHLLPFAYHQLNVGRMFNQWLPSNFSAEEQAVADLFTETEGYYPLSEPSDPKRQAFLQNQSAYQQALTDLTIYQATAAEQATVEAEIGQEPYLSANKRMLLSRITDAVRAAGAEPIFIEPPSLHMANDFRTAQALGDIDTVLSYKDPAQYPELYRPDQRHDADHLNDEGAQAFTRMLAEDFRQLVSERP